MRLDCITILGPRPILGCQKRIEMPLGVYVIPNASCTGCIYAHCSGKA